MIKALQTVKDLVLVACGVLSVGMGISGFLVSSQFIDGGITGISMLAADISGLPISTLLVILNVPFIVLGYHKIGWKFALKTSVAILALAICLHFIPYPDVTPDKLLSALRFEFGAHSEKGLE